MMRFVECAIPPHAHPLVREFFRLRNRERAPLALIHKRAGLGRDTIKSWRDKHVPSIANFDAALRVLGYRLEIVKVKEDEE